MLLTATTASWAVGNALRFYNRVVVQSHEFPAPADAFYLLALPLAAAAMLSLSEYRRVGSRLRVVLDGVIVATSLLFVSWAVVLEPLDELNGQSTLAKTVALAYPMGDVLIATLALVVAGRSRPSLRLQPLLVASGIGAYAVADSMYAYLTGIGEWAVGTPVDAGWVVGYLLIALAAAAPVDDRDDAPVERRRTVITELAPYVAPLVASVVALTRRATPDSDPVLFTIGAVMMVVLAVRQVLIVTENIHLTRDLEGQVEERTDQLEAVARRFRSLVQNSSDVTMIITPGDEIGYASPSVRRVLGRADAELVHRRFGDLVHPDDHLRLRPVMARADWPEQPHSIEVRLRHAAGEWVRGELTVNDLTDDPSVAGLVMNFRDLSERLELEEQIRRRELFDPLTSLPNKVLFRERLEQAIERPDSRPPAVLSLDLDGFKAVNELQGHVVGDELLNCVASRLRGCAREGDLVARFGGDEFAVLVDDADEEDAVEVAERLLWHLRSPFMVEGRRVFVQASIGIANGRDEGAAELLRNADVAMYAAKAEGKARYKVFQPSMHQSVVRRLELVDDLRHAVEREELVLDLQPILGLEEDRIVNLEALVRWAHPVRGLIPPTDFIPVAEETGLIVPIGMWVLRRACQEARAWLDDDPHRPPVSVAVNLSAVQLRDEGLADDVASILAETGLPASCLKLEITESVVMEESDVAFERLRQLAELGAVLAIDDFGTGYSSLSRLRQFPVQELTVDRSFVAEITASDAEAPIVTGIIAMAHGLGLPVVAEGVESPEQLAFLRRQRCDRVQGYLFSRPVPAGEVRALLAGDAEAHTALEEAVLGSPERHLMDLVREAIASGGELEQVTRPLLAELQRRTGLESTYLTQIHWDRVEQEILFSHNADGLQVPEGLLVAWSDTLCRQALMGGPESTDDVPGTYPASQVARAVGIQSYVSVPVMGGNGNLFGTLCGASRDRQQVSCSLVTLMRLFAELIADRLPSVPPPPPLAKPSPPLPPVSSDRRRGAPSPAATGG